MKIRRPRSGTFDLTPKEAVQLQRRLAARVIARGAVPRPLRRVAAVDCSLAQDGVLAAAAIVCEAPDWRVVERRVVARRPAMPYVPGLLSFREAPLVLEALAALESSPQALLVDGQGVAHPRRLGIAAHVGLHLDIPTVGVAKSLLVGTHGPLAPERGAHAPLVHQDERIGLALRTRDGVKPVYVSVGHRIGLLPAMRLVLRTGSGFRLPEPIRQADAESRRAARSRQTR